MDIDEVFVKNNIAKKLKQFDMPELGNLKHEIIEYLIKIEKAIIEIENERNNGLYKYKNSKVNPNTIRSKTGMSRTTIYKYKDILLEYINNTQCELQKNDVTRISQFQNDIINELKEQIRKLQFKSLKEQILLDKIESQEKEYNNLIKQMKNLQAENTKLYSDIEKLKIKKSAKITEIF